MLKIYINKLFNYLDGCMGKKNLSFFLKMKGGKKMDYMKKVVSMNYPTI